MCLGFLFISSVTQMICGHRCKTDGGARTHLGIFWGAELFEGLRALNSRVLQLLVPLHGAVFSVVLQPCWRSRGEKHLTPKE